jgi:hypothetical protein
MFSFLAEPSFVLFDEVIVQSVDAISGSATMSSSREAERNSSAQETLDSKLFCISIAFDIYVFQSYTRYLNC